MLSNEKIIEAIHNAMALHSCINNGKVGVSKNGLKIAINNLGGDEEDVKIAMLAVLNLLTSKCQESSL